MDVSKASATIRAPITSIAVQVTSVASKCAATSPEVVTSAIMAKIGSQRRNRVYGMSAKEAPKNKPKKPKMMSRNPNCP